MFTPCGRFLHVQVRVIQSFEASPQRGCLEVHEEPRWMPRELQVRDDLREVDGMDAFDRFQFQNEAAFNQQVQLQIGGDPLAPVLEADAPLALDQQVLGQPTRESCTLDTRTQAGPVRVCDAPRYRSRSLSQSSIPNRRAGRSWRPAGAQTAPASVLRVFALKPIEGRSFCTRTEPVTAQIAPSCLANLSPDLLIFCESSRVCSLRRSGWLSATATSEYTAPWPR